MSCEPMKEKLLDFLYDEMAEADHEEVVRHLKTCAECAAAINELKLLRNTLAEWKDPAAREFPMTLPYPSPLRLIRQWLLPTRLTWRNAFTFATATGLVLLVTFSILGTEVKINRDGVAFRSDLMRRKSAESSVAETKSPRAAPNRDVVSGRTGRNEKTPSAASIQEVAQMIQESEARQQQLLKTEEMRLVNQLTTSYRSQLTRLASTLDSKHQLDLAAFYDNLEQQRLTDLQKIRLTFASLDELTSQQAVRTQQLVDLIQKASYQPK